MQSVSQYQQAQEVGNHVNDRFLRLPGVKTLSGLSKASIYKGIKAGTFPAPLKLGRASAWRATAINAWMAAQGEQQ